VDIRQLRYFVGVLEARSLSKASDLLHVAQPALGVQIRNLERELGAKLLHRHPRGIAPTEAGERLAQHAGLLLRQFDRVRQDLIDYATTPSGRVQLCVGRTVPRIVTATIAERCRRKFPDIQLRIIEGWRKQLEEGSDAAGVDLVVSFRPLKDIQIGTESLVQDELLLVSSAKDVPLPREVDFRTVSERALILPSEPHFIRHLVEEAAKLAGTELKVYCDIDSIATTKELVRRGVADTILPIASVRDDVESGRLQTARIKNRKLQRTLHISDAPRRLKTSTVDLVRREVRSIIVEFAQDETFGWKEMM
jgi:LysR family transcriptional regulator, nitrogen assimilation regulatory protein